MFRVSPVEQAFLEDGRQFGLVGKEQRQVGRQDAVFDVAQCLFVLGTRQLSQDVVAFLQDSQLPGLRT